MDSTRCSRSWRDRVTLKIVQVAHESCLQQRASDDAPMSLECNDCKKQTEGATVSCKTMLESIKRGHTQCSLSLETQPRISRAESQELGCWEATSANESASLVTPFCSPVLSAQSLSNQQIAQLFATQKNCNLWKPVCCFILSAVFGECCHLSCHVETCPEVAPQMWAGGHSGSKSSCRQWPHQLVGSLLQHLPPAVLSSSLLHLCLCQQCFPSLQCWPH